MSFNFSWSENPAPGRCSVSFYSAEVSNILIEKIMTLNILLVIYHVGRTSGLACDTAHQTGSRLDVRVTLTHLIQVSGSDKNFAGTG